MVPTKDDKYVSEFNEPPTECVNDDSIFIKSYSVFNVTLPPTTLDPCLNAY